MHHAFTDTIYKILKSHYGDKAERVFNTSLLLQYLNLKTISAYRGSKARSSFGNLYAIYVLVEDYIAGGYADTGDYSSYEGAKFSDLLKRQKELPFAARLQNHSLNHRMNQEFKRYFPTCDCTPIIRVADTKRYWINTNLIELRMGGDMVNVARPIIEVIDAYVDSKKEAFERFMATCKRLKEMTHQGSEENKAFITGLLQTNVDARIFEIVSYAILKASYGEQSIFFGFTRDAIEEQNLRLYKTGRTHANDGGIDFVMKPLGRFFQVTESLDIKKYLLDIDKVEKFPITFVVKSLETPEATKQRIRAGAERQYAVDAIVEKYVACIEEIINIAKLKEALEGVESRSGLGRGSE